MAQSQPAVTAAAAQTQPAVSVKDADRLLKAGNDALARGTALSRLTSRQLKGKWVLLDFWATWCGPCVAEMPTLKEVHETYGNDKRFVVVSLSIDKDEAKPREFVAEKGYNWTHGFLGIGWDAPLMKMYGVRGIPSIFLISPDGRIAANGLRGDKLKAAVAQALGK